MSSPSTPPAWLVPFLPPAQALELEGPSPRSRAVLYTLVALVLVSVLWSALAQIDKMVIGRGRIVVPTRNLVVQPLETGVLRSIDVHIGQKVAKGTVLATLDPTFATADANALTSRSQALGWQVQRLNAEAHSDRAAFRASAPGDGPEAQLQRQLLDERRAMYAAKVLQYEETIRRLQASQETNRQDQEVLARRLKALQQLEDMHRELADERYIAPAQKLSMEERRIEVERDHRQAVNRAQELGRELASTRAELLAFQKTFRQDAMEQLTSVTQQRRETDEQLAKAQLRARLVTLTAPEDAIVLAIENRSIGSVMKEAEPLFSLVPQNQTLEAEVEITPSEIADVRVGDTVRLKLDAYPFQKHGAAQGKIIALTPDALTRQGAMGESISYYMARVAFTDVKLAQLPAAPTLLPGMTLSGEVVTGQRSVLSFFTYPILRVMDESLRER